MALPILYARREDGKIQCWDVIVKGWTYRSRTWIHPDGSINASAWTTCVAKRGTTPAQQSEREARAMWKKKQDQGYKLKIDDVDIKTFFQPMLAHEYGDYKHLVDEALQNKERVYLQPKLDGMRAIVTHEGMWSRRGKPIISAPHIFTQIKELMTACAVKEYIVDGELYTHKHASDFNAIISLAKKTKPTDDDLAKSARSLQYHIYDLGHTGDTFFLRNNRMGMMRHKLDELRLKGMSSMIRMVPTGRAKSLNHIERIYQSFVERGYEGAMIRLDRSYENKRSKFLLKFKAFKSEEFTILDVIEGQGNRAGMCGALSFKTSAGRPFTAAVKGGVEFYKRILKDKQNMKGKLAEVEYFNMTPDGSPRFPIVKTIRDYD